MPKGGKRNGAGRPKGSISLSTRAIMESAASGGELPIAYMLRVMRDEKLPGIRRDRMARAAASYLHAKVLADPLDEEDAAAEDAAEAAALADAADAAKDAEAAEVAQEGADNT